MNFFFDRNLSYRLARMLHAYDPNHVVKHHDDDFVRTCQDIEWIQSLASAEEPWFVITGDGRILTKPAERAALRATELSAFFLKPGWLKLSFHQQAVNLLGRWPMIVEYASKNRRPMIYEIPVRAKKIEIIGLTERV